MVVLGEPGAGKSALIAAWARAGRERGVTVLASRAEDGSLALQPVIDALAGRLFTPPLPGLTADGASQDDSFAGNSSSSCSRHPTAAPRDRSPPPTPSSGACLLRSMKL